ncbi:DoxX family protein [Kitasatospora sp. NPDC093550]|uniref:DoxX family protein n=1 Tax=Kitasatospora sp. NPDC093550 TaxID=3364089 RepID=UPI0038273067
MLLRGDGGHRTRSTPGKPDRTPPPTPSSAARRAGVDDRPDRRRRLAALGLVLLMAGAAVVRLRRREYGRVVADVVYILLAASVVWGRFGPQPF